MTEDTRKDKRAKIVSLNVRYKSATVDEFIENHSHDVSKGGLFIKTPTPFPPGTLIKFEIRIAGDKPVIMGVGRVVWKRDPGQAAGDRPSGMGVKFIKIDEPSRQVIERVVAEKEGAGAAYASEGETDSASLTAARSASDLPLNAKLTPVPGAGPRVPLEKKSTMMGIGAVSSPPPANDATVTIGKSMFPTTSESDMPPPKERTVMKQAAELLEEALKEAGGSMEEIGTNPLFAEGHKLDPRIVAAGEVEKKAATSASPIPAAPSGSTKAASNPPQPAAKVSTTSGHPSGPRAAAPAAKTPSTKVPLEDTGPRRRTSEPAPRRVSAAKELAHTPAKKGSNAFLWALLIVLVAGGGVAYQMGFFGPASTPPPPEPPVPSAASPAPETSASAAAVAPAAASAGAPATSTSAPVAAASASASAAPSATSAHTAASATAPPAATTAPPKATPAPTAPPATAATTSPAATTPPAATTSTPAPAPTPKPKPSPAATDTSAATPAATATTPPPKPKPKPKTSDDDNPY